MVSSIPAQCEACGQNVDCGEVEAFLPAQGVLFPFLFLLPSWMVWKYKKKKFLHEICLSCTAFSEATTMDPGAGGSQQQVVLESLGEVLRGQKQDRKERRKSEKRAEMQRQKLLEEGMRASLVLSSQGSERVVL